MKSFLEPESVAVIGASNDISKVGNSLMKNLRKFEGDVIPVNLREDEVDGKKAYRSVLSYPDSIDLAVIAVPALVVKNVLRECGEKGIKSVIIISSGFSEVGQSEEELKEIASKYGMRVLGPNTFGNVNPYIGFDSTFALTTPDKGDIAFVSQSGALWAALVEFSKGRFGFSGYVSLGNMIDLEFADFIEYFDKDKNTKVIVCYIEKLKDGSRFIEVCKKSKKPIVVIKAGKERAGVKAAMSHTGSMAGDFEIYRAAFKQAGVYVAESFSELFDKAMFLGKQELRGSKTVIVTNGGGAGVLAADQCESNGLDVVSLGKGMMSGLNRKLPSAWSHNNPIDVVGDANYDRYKTVFDVLRRYRKEFDNVLVVLTQQKMIDVRKTALEVIDFKGRSGKAVVCAFMGGAEIGEAKSLFVQEGIPCFFNIRRAVRVLSG